MAEETKKTKTTEAKKPDLKPGMVVKVHEKIKETTAKGGEKERIQVFEGLVIAAKHGQEPGATITVRKVSQGGYGVEKIYPIHSPVVAKIEVVKKYKVRRAHLGYVRDPKFKRRLKEERSKA